MNWATEGNLKDGDFIVYDEKNDEEILEIRHGFISKKHLNLILAAPDLLDALIELVSCLDAGYKGEFTKARAAIAKATQ